MLSTPLICSSIGVATESASVCASPPTNEVEMLISGGTMLGNCATGRLNIETAPMITIKMAMTIATIGRLMKNLYMAKRAGNYLEGFVCVAEFVPA